MHHNVLYIALAGSPRGFKASFPTRIPHRHCELQNSPPGGEIDYTTVQTIKPLFRLIVYGGAPSHFVICVPPHTQHFFNLLFFLLFLRCYYYFALLSSSITRYTQSRTFFLISFLPLLILILHLMR